MVRMRLVHFLIPALVLAIAACTTGPRPIAELPPARLSTPPVHNAAPPHHATVSPQAPAGPLTLARVDSYMDGLETELRRHLHGVVVARQGENINLVISNALLFSEDGGLKGDDVLEPLAAILKSYDRTVVQVSGYTDTSGSPQSNLAVSQKRARSIADALAHEGVSAARLSSQGFGETHLRVATGDNKDEPRNRRIEILINARPG
jgi:outer membrane protein OmpA-like peptidoglycan-associated protein